MKDETTKNRMPTLDRATVKRLTEPEKNRLRALALSLIAKGQRASGTETIILPVAESKRLRNLIECGMLPGDHPVPKTITPEDDKRLRRIAEQRVRAADEDFDPVLHDLAERINAGTATGKDRDKFTRLIAKRRKTPHNAVPAFVESPAESKQIAFHYAVIIANRNAEAERKAAADRDRIAAVDMDAFLERASGKGAPLIKKPATKAGRTAPLTVDQIDRLPKDQREPWMNCVLAYARAAGNTDQERWKSVALKIQTGLQIVQRDRAKGNSQTECEYLTANQAREWLQKMQTTGSVEFIRALASALRRNVQRKPVILPKLTG